MWVQNRFVHEAAETLPPAEPATVADAGGHPLCVLVVEPAPLLRTLIRLALESTGYEVVCAASLAEAEVALSRRPSIVISELNLADGSGDTVCRRLRALSHRHVPFVLMSSGPEETLARRAALCEADRCFEKPRGLDALLPLVHELALELDEQP